LSPDPQLVAAFALAKLGRRDEALVRLANATEYATHGEALRDAYKEV
jgi:hypothetical protein